MRLHATFMKSHNLKQKKKQLLTFEYSKSVNSLANAINVIREVIPNIRRVDKNQGSLIQCNGILQP